MYKLLNIILIPLSWIYRVVVGLRNWAYDKKWLKSVEVSVPTIAVGNLAVGGTGKTPLVELLIRRLSEQYQVAVLSRGYGRKTKGFVLVDESATALTVGDEMMQMAHKFPSIAMAVCENRVEGTDPVQTGISSGLGPGRRLESSKRHRFRQILQCGALRTGE